MMAMGQGGGSSTVTKTASRGVSREPYFWGGEEKKIKMNALYNILKRRRMHNMGCLSNYLAQWLVSYFTSVNFRNKEITSWACALEHFHCSSHSG